MKLKYLIPLLLFIFSGNAMATSIEPMLEALDQVLDSADFFTARRQERIDRLMSDRAMVLHDKARLYEVNRRLADEYRSFMCDSASRYMGECITLAKAMGNVSYENASKIRLSYHLASSGIYEVSLDLLRSVSRSDLTPSQLIDYYVAMDHVYGEMSISKYSGQFPLLDYAGKSQAYKDSIHALIDTNHPRALEMAENSYRDAHDLDRALAINNTRLSLTRQGTPQYALVMFHRSLVDNQEGDTIGEMQCLCLSAMTDIRLATKDHASLWHLARLLMNCGDLERANRYMRFSWAETNFYNSPLRNLQSSSIQSLIESQYQEQILASNSKLKVFVWIVSALVVLLLVAFIYIWRQKRKVDTAHHRLQEVNLRLNQLNGELNNLNHELATTNALLSESDSIKEVYISRFIRLCSEYVDRLDKLRVTVNKKLATGKTAEVVKLTRSTDITDEAVAMLYENFDTAFLHIFPDFVAKFNELLLDDERIILKNDELLNTELRIFALIRLGFSDSSQIAEFLRYSVNTIYNYRAKVKNRAKVNRADFEDLVCKIR